MTHDMPPLDSSTMRALIEENINAYVLSFAALPGACLRQDDRLAWVDSGVGGSDFNAVAYARFTPEGADVGIESILTHFRERAAARSRR